jgi:hypothetical protein
MYQNRSNLTLRSPSPLFISTTSPTTVPLLHNPLPLVLLLLSLTFMLFCPVQSRLLCGPSVSQPLNAIFIQATVFLVTLAAHNDKNTRAFCTATTNTHLIEFNWNTLGCDYYLRNWMHPLYVHFLIAFLASLM